jgi:7,8-dihydropterin-6-yl-methyl-4-(beta-D-ribofuranosyl)aminobenzene 5'-phosphate synthase
VKNKVKITVLAEEKAGRQGLVAKHAWAVWIETDYRRVLFDVGQGPETVSNAQILGIELKQCDAIVLSHGHYDHTGGLEQVLSITQNAKIYAHPKVSTRKYARNNDGTSRNNGMPQICREAVGRNPKLLIETLTPTDLGFGLWVTGEIPRKTVFEDSGGAYFVDPQCSEPDLIEDDQALFFDSVHGLVVILGCAHAGAINTIEYIRELTGGKKIHAILGGMHLIHASDERIQSTVEALESINPDILGIAHCTGAVAAEKLKTAFDKKCIELCAGTRISFEAPQPT